MSGALRKTVGKYDLSLDEIPGGCLIRIQSADERYSGYTGDLFNLVQFYHQELARSEDQNEFLGNVRRMMCLKGDELALLNQILNADAWGLFRKMFAADVKPLTLTEQLNRSVKTLPLSSRMEYALTETDTHLIGQLVQKTRRELLKVRHMGPATLRELEAILAGIDLRLEMTPSDIGNWVYPRISRNE
jgi:hypothetical protein